MECSSFERAYFLRRSTLGSSLSEQEDVRYSSALLQFDEDRAESCHQRRRLSMQGLVLGEEGVGVGVAAMVQMMQEGSE